MTNVHICDALSCSVFGNGVYKLNAGTVLQYTWTVNNTFIIKEDGFVYSSGKNLHG